jgi:predicted Zn-dependent protease
MTGWWRVVVLGVALLATLTLPVAQRAAAHGDLHVQIEAVSRQIEKDPGNAGLYLKRGELFRVHRELDSALADYARAEDRDPALSLVDLCRGRAYLEGERPREARPFLDRYLKTRHDDPEGLLVRARTLARLGLIKDSETDFARLIALSAGARPEVYVERAQALSGGGKEDLERALGGLDEGISRLGPLVTLELCGIALDLKLARFDEALERVERVARQSSRKETWLVKKAEILKAAGRGAEARNACDAALREIEALPARLRGARAMRDLEGRIRNVTQSTGNSAAADL